MTTQAKAQQWHDTDHGSTEANGYFSCWCCCTGCDPDYESDRPNPYWAEAQASMNSGWKAQVNNDLLWESPDGREAFVTFSPGRGLAHICTDINRPHSVPEQSVGFTPEALRFIADRIEALDNQDGG